MAWLVIVGFLASVVYVMWVAIKHPANRAHSYVSSGLTLVFALIMIIWVVLD